MDAHEQAVLGVVKPRVQPLRRARAALDRDHLVRLPQPEAGRGKQASMEGVGARQVVAKPPFVGSMDCGTPIVACGDGPRLPVRIGLWNPWRVGV
jgi:hypothetical protein